MFNLITDKKGFFLNTIEFYVQGEEVGHIRYWYNDSDMTHTRLIKLFKDYNENTYEVSMNFPAYQFEGHSLYIHHLLVEKDYRNKGYATEMLRYIIEDHFGGLNQVLLAYDESKPWLVDFYKKNITEDTLEEKNTILFNL